MKLQDALEIGDDTNVILRKLKDKKITELGTEISEVIADTTIGDLITLDDDVPPLLNALKDTKLNQNDLKTAIEGFTISDIFVDASSGVLGLVPADTKLDALPRAIGDAVQNTNVYKLDALNVIDAGINEYTNPEIKAKIYNNTAAKILSEYVGVLNDPTTAQSKLATKKFKFTGNTLTQVALADMGVQQGDSVVLTQNTVIPAGEVFDIPFNILAVYEYVPDLTKPTQTESGNYTLTIGENVKIKGCGYMYVQAEYYGTSFSNITSADQIEVSSTSSVAAVKIQAVAMNKDSVEE